MSGALSPPIPSRAMTILPGSLIVAGGRDRRGDGPRLSRSRCLRDHLALAVIAARAADVVRTHQLAAIGTLDIGRALQGMVRAPHVAPRFADLLLGNSHDTISNPDAAGPDAASRNPGAVVARAPSYPKAGGAARTLPASPRSHRTLTSSPARGGR